jgi:hypothetical protein
VAKPSFGHPRDTPTWARAPPPSLGPLGPPRPAVAAAECHGAIALLPSLCTMSGRRSAPSPEGAGAAACSREPRALEDPARGRGRGAGRRRGGGPDRVWEGRGAAQRQPPPPPAPASTFCTARRGTSPKPPESCHRLHPGGRAAELGAGSPKQPAPGRTEANLAARPAPQPFSRGTRGSGRGGDSAAVPAVTAADP